jgi:hypothetical protein
MLETACDAGGGSMSSFIVFIRAHGQSLVQVTAVCLAHMATPIRTDTVNGYTGTVVRDNGLHKSPTERTSHELPKFNF